MTRRDLLAAIDGYVRDRVESAELEAERLRAEVAALREQMRERLVREAAGAEVDLTDLRRVVRGYDSSRRQGKATLQERIARALLARMVAA